MCLKFEEIVKKAGSFKTKYYEKGNFFLDHQLVKKERINTWIGKRMT